MSNQWKHQSGFILAAAGSAVGLGNLWKFPYVVGVHGGGAFVLIYLLCIIFLGIPALTSEVSIGHNSQKALWPTLRTYPFGKTLAALTLTASTCIPAFYSVVGGWILGFLYAALTGELVADPETPKTFQDTLSASWTQSLLWQLSFLGISFAIVGLGVQNGIEKASKILMPVLLFLLLGLFFISASMPGFQEALIFLFEPRFDTLTSAGLYEALGHSFFTLSVGCGVMLTYGSYLPRHNNVFQSVLAVILMDTLIALCAGCVIFTCVFSYNLSPESGPALLFKTLPVLFTQMPMGRWVAIGFFALVTITALTSMISLLEVLATAVPQKKPHRGQAMVWVFCWLTPFALAANFSWNLWKKAPINPFQIMDFLASNILLPAGGVAFLLLYGWSHKPQGLIGFLCRYISPCILLAVWTVSWFL